MNVPCFSRLTRENIVDAVMNGCIEANKEYEGMSGGLWIHDQGIENLLSSTIARSIHVAIKASNSRMMLTMETLLREVEECSTGARKPGPKEQEIRGTARADIVLWSARNEPRAVIEVKRKWLKAECLRDVDRIRIMIDRIGPDRGGALRFGILVIGLYSKTGGPSVEQKFRDAKKEMRDHLHRFGGQISSAFRMANDRHTWSNGKGETWVASAMVAYLWPRRSTSSVY